MEEPTSLKLIHEDKFSEIFSQTVEDMKKLGTYSLKRVKGYIIW